MSHPSPRAGHGDDAPKRYSGQQRAGELDRPRPPDSSTDPGRRAAAVTTGSYDSESPGNAAALTDLPT